MAAVRIVSVLIALCVLGPGKPANASEMGETAIGVDQSNYDGHRRRIDDGESD